MSDLELRSLSPKLRGLVGEISDADVAHYPTVLAATEELRAVQAEHAMLRGAVNKCETSIQAVEVRIGEVTQRIDTIEDARRALALEIFERTRTDEEDRTMHAELQDLRRRLSQLELVLDSFREQHRLALHEISRESRSRTLTDAQRKLDEAVFQAKLARCRELA
jgi:chromosome segregation ATPase